MKLEAFCGLLGGGKDYYCNKLIKEGYVQINFADSLRKLTYEVCGYVPKNYDKFKECVVGLDHYPLIFSKLLLKLFPNLITGRKLLQRIGSEVVRKVDKGYFVKEFKNAVSIEQKQGKKVCCSDARFENELRLVVELGGTICFCDYPSERNIKQCIEYGKGVAPHQSELLSYDLKYIHGTKHGDDITWRFN